MLKHSLYTILLFASMTISAQTILQAKDSADVYKQINEVLAPGYNVVETPDCAHTDFGDHITQQWDDDLNKHVFVFHAHVNEDNDRCKKDDRQRTEIKTYKQSPDNLKATDGETVIYKWKFKLDKDFQVSKKFTHLHQIKAVGGSEDKMPTITFTARKSSKEDKFIIRYASHLEQEDLAKVALEDFRGVWVEVEEQITYGENGKYEVKITSLDKNKELLNYKNTSMRMWKTNADFLRPKWGIYRSLQQAQDLRDEKVLFADFYIEEL